MKEQSPKWSEIRASYIEESDPFKVMHIDGYPHPTKTNDEPDGTVIAKLVGIKVHDTIHIYESIDDPDVRIDPMAQQMIAVGRQKLIEAW